MKTQISKKQAEAWSLPFWYLQRLISFLWTVDRIQDTIVNRSKCTSKMSEKHNCKWTYYIRIPLISHIDSVITLDADIGTEIYLGPFVFLSPYCTKEDGAFNPTFALFFFNTQVNHLGHPIIHEFYSAFGRGLIGLLFSVFCNLSNLECDLTKSKKTLCTHILPETFKRNHLE